MSIIKYHNMPNSEQLMKLFKVENVNELPTVKKVVINVGVGKLEKADREKTQDTVANIIGQKLALTSAKKSVAGFKTRAGQIVGMKATIRGPRMWLFINKLVNVTLPRTRDFRGLKQSGITKGGCLNIGIRDLSIFPEVKVDNAFNGLGMQVGVLTSAKNVEEAKKYFISLGFPLEK